MSDNWKTWQDRIIYRLLLRMYTEEGAATSLAPILADVLEEAGYPDNSEIAHLRDSNGHNTWCVVLQHIWDQVATEEEYKRVMRTAYPYT